MSTNTHSGPRPQWECLKGGLAELNRHFDARRVTPEGRRRVLAAFSGDPAKRVNATLYSAAWRIACPPFGCTVNAASEGEAAFVLRCLHSHDVHLCADQPFTVKLRKRDSRGRLRRDPYTPDFLTLETAGFFVTECKTREELEADLQHPYPRYRREGAGWIYPAAREYFAALGIEHRVVVAAEDVSYVWLRNMRYLSGHVDGPEPEGVERALWAVRDARSAQLSALLELDGVTSPALMWLVANRRIHCDLERERVFDSDEVWLHETEAAALAHRYLLASPEGEGADAPGWPLHHDVRPVVLDPGAQVLFRDLHCQVVDRSADAVTLRSTLEVGGDFQLIPIAPDDVHKLLRSGDLRAAGSLGDEALARERHEIFVTASPAQLAQAVKWWRDLRFYAEHGRVPEGSSKRTLERRRQWVRRAKRRYGYGFLGLLRPQGRAVGTVRVPEVQRTLIAKAVAQYRGDEGPDLASRREGSAYALFRKKCDEAKLAPDDVVSESTFRRYARVGSAASAEALRRGARAGYQLRGPRLRLGPSLPRHGDRVWERAHVDHALLNLIFVSARTGAVLGRVWLTVLVDAFSRLVLAFRLSFDAPSRESVFAVLYDCVFRHRRLPEFIVVDQGSDFMSDDFDVALAYLGVSKIERPASHPRYGSVIERLFGTLNTRLVHEQPGSTEPVHLGRALSASHRPERRAAWTLRAFHPVAERWLFDTYPDLVHSSLGATPREVWERSLSRSGEHVARYIACDDALRSVLSQSVDSGGERVVNPGGTVFVKHLYFAHPALEDKRLIGTKVRVWLCLADASYVWVYVPHRGERVRAHVCDGDADLAGLSWRAVNCAMEELRAQRAVGRSQASRKRNASDVGAALVDAREAAREGAADALARRAERDAEQGGLGASPAAPPPAEGAPASGAAGGSDGSAPDDDIDFPNLKGF